MVCRTDRGNAKVFSCFYHAWSFNTDGELVGVPDRQAYGDGLDFSKLGGDWGDLAAITGQIP